MKFDKDAENKDKEKPVETSKDRPLAESDDPDGDWEPTDYYDKKSYHLKPKKKRSPKHKLKDMLRELEFKDDEIKLVNHLGDVASSAKKSSKKSGKPKGPSKKKDAKSETPTKKKDEKSLTTLEKELKKLESNVKIVKKLV